jgi:hypothetical protein
VSEVGGLWKCFRVESVGVWGKVALFR